MPLRNTGFQRIEEKDINPNSPTYGQIRWRETTVQDLEACPPPAAQSWQSREISEIVFRNNCGAGQTGGSVVYVLAAGHYVSLISQADANMNAQAYFNSTKQQYANDHATCGGADPGTEDCPDPGPEPTGDNCFDPVTGQQVRAVLCTSGDYPYCQYWSCGVACGEY